ncbi:MAG: TIGR04283 family arsenosugar biosynthesis glycosyltransferase [Pseudomonadota bacterium]
MAAPISVVIPTLNAADDLPQTLSALVEGLGEGLIREVVVSDGGSTDGTRAVAEAAGTGWVPGPPGRGGQLARGCAAARGDWLLVVHADTHLEPGWSIAAQAALHEPARAHAFRLRFRAAGFGPAWVAGWANMRSRAFGLPYGDQGLLIARTLYDEIGGFPDIPLMEDVALVRALPSAPRLMTAEARTSFARYAAEGWVRRGARNLWTYARWRAGASPDRLVGGYAGGASSRN